MKAEDIKNLKIAIVGAGYGGAAAAKALSLLGADVTVLDRDPRTTDAAALGDTEIVLTMVEGTVVTDRAPRSAR